jgi:hypothetical protein
MNSEVNEKHERFEFEYTPYQYSRRVFGHHAGDIKRQCMVDVYTRGEKTHVIVSEDDAELSQKAKRLNFADITFQLRQKGHLSQPWIYDHNIEWWKTDGDLRKKLVFRHVTVGRPFWSLSLLASFSGKVLA